ncbi:MAG: RNA polymerase sigma factor [Planctomycetota bacterium]
MAMESNISVDNDSQAAKDSESTVGNLGDPAVFTRLYRRHYDAVFRYCVHRLFDRQAAEDVTSTVFFKVVENVRRFKGTEQQFRNWLYRIATNAVNNHLRQAARRDALLKAVEQSTVPTTDCPDSGNESAEKLAVLKQALQTLKPRYQTIITLRFFENLKLTEIAEVLGSRPGTVRSQLARALAKLRNRLAAFEQEV